MAVNVLIDNQDYMKFSDFQESFDFYEVYASATMPGFTSLE